MAVELSDSFFARIAGWDVVKAARNLLAQDRVLSSAWTPPLLKGVVQEGQTSYAAGLVIKSAVDIENICTCRQSREWGTMCQHSIAAGLHFVKSQAAPAPQSVHKEAPPANRLPLATTDEDGVPAEIFVILPPHIEQAIARDKIMLCLETEVNSKRLPLNSLPKSQRYSFSPQDAALLQRLEAARETPAMLMVSAKEFAAILSLLIGHSGVTLGKGRSINITNEAWSPKVKVDLQSDGAIRLSVKSTSAPCIVAGTWVYRYGQFQRLGLPAPYLAALTTPLVLARDQVPSFITQELPGLLNKGLAEINFDPASFVLETAKPEFDLHLKGGLAMLDATLVCRYGRTEISAASAEQLWIPDPAAPFRYLARDLPAERAARLD